MEGLFVFVVWICSYFKSRVRFQILKAFPPITACLSFFDEEKTQNIFMGFCFIKLYCVG